MDVQRYEWAVMKELSMKRRFRPALGVFVLALLVLALSLVSKLNGAFGYEAVYSLTVCLDISLLAICINFFISLVRGIVAVRRPQRFWMIVLGIELLLVGCAFVAILLMPPLHYQILIPIVLGFIVSVLVAWGCDTPSVSR